MIKLFDTHAHYFDENFDKIGGADAILESQEFGELVGGVINVGTRYENSLVCIEMAQKYDFMYAAVGIHPSDAQRYCTLSPEEEIARIRELVCDKETQKKNKIVAIGEIGYDYYWQPVDKELQKRYFEGQMELAREVGLPVVIHDRDAHGDSFDMIRRFPDVIGVFHTCGLSPEMVREVVKRGWYVSYSGPITYKNANNVRQSCAAAPLDRILIETDAPYLTPVPYRGKLNNSIYMQKTAEAVAEVHGLTLDEIAKITFENACRLFNI